MTVIHVIAMMMMMHLAQEIQGIGSQYFGLPGHYDTAYKSVSYDGTPLEDASRDAWISHNQFSLPPIINALLSGGSRSRVSLPNTVFTRTRNTPAKDNESSSSNSSSVSDRVVNLPDWRIADRVPHRIKEDPEERGAAGPTAPEWIEGVSPFIVAGPAVGQNGLPAPGHQHSDGRRSERIPFLYHFLPF